MQAAIEDEACTKLEIVSGIIERITYRNENDWSVLRVKIGKSNQISTVTGHCNAQVGEQIHAKGEWKNAAPYGMQFVAETVSVSKPNTPEGLTRYLGSGVIKGVGQSTAKKIVNAFGMNTISILDESPEKLKDIAGIGVKKADKIAQAWGEQKAVSEIMLFLNEHHIAPYLCRRIYNQYSVQSIEKIQSNPYILSLEVSGIGYKTADKIAQQFDIPLDSAQRIKAALVYLMQQANSNGNCGVIKSTLVQSAVELLNVSPERIQYVLECELKLLGTNKYLVEHENIVYTCVIAACEERIASTIYKMANSATPWTIDAVKAVDDAQNELGITLANQQRAGVIMMLNNRVSVLTGGPGTGKTSTLNVLLHIFKKHKIDIHLAAPTGKAAQRAGEVTGLPSSTIHRLLGLGKSSAPTNIINNGVVVIDESSMIDVFLANNITKSITNCGLIFVGDINQLPSVGAGQVLSDIINSGVVPVTELTEVFRQAAGSLIIRNAHHINNGDMPEKGEKTDDFFFIELPEKDNNGKKIEPSVIGEQIQKMIVDLVADRLPRAYGFDSFKDIMVLSPMNVSNTGVQNLNIALQARLNPKPAAHLMQFGTRFGIGDKVIQTKNNYDLEIFNGDVGIILKLDDEENLMFVDFGDKVVEIPYDDIDALRLAYSMTIHKSQGSQAQAVIIPVTTSHFTMLQRNLFYTGVTRAKKLVVLVGQRRALEMAVRNNKVSERLTRLKKLLQGLAYKEATQ
jgi:exodeoxyribonuclease V alpha subunit